MATEITQWIGPDGTATALDVDWSATGRFMPPVAHQEQAAPGQPGSYVYQSLHGARDFTLPIWVYGNTDTELRTQLRSLAYQMSPDRGTGRIRVTSPLGDQREVWCRYSDGLNLDESAGNASISSQKAAVVFRAFNPYWWDVASTSRSWMTGTPPVFFPFFPLRLTASSISVQATINNNGDVPTWPVFQVTGPATNIELLNATTGLQMYFGSLALTAGQTLTVDTRPGIKSLTLQDGSNAFTYLSTDSDLWPLVVGANAVNLVAAGTTPATSGLQVTYYQGYLTP